VKIKQTFHIAFLMIVGCAVLWLDSPSARGQMPTTTEENRELFRSGPRRELTSVAFGDRLFVAVGFHRLILTSADGTNWTERCLAPEISTVGINFTTENYVAGGQSLTLAIPSGEPTQTVVRPSPFLFRSIGFGNGQFVIVGDSGEIRVSSDGEYWRLASTPTVANLYGVTAGDGKFVAVGDDGTIVTSSDAVHWTLHNSGRSYRLWAVAYGNRTFVAVGGDDDNSVILTSEDGAHWTPNSVNRLCPIGAVTFGNGEFLASAAGGYQLTLMSMDGRHWREVRHPSTSVRALAFGGGQFVAVDASAQPTISTNGSDWQPPFAERSFGFDYYGATYGNGEYVLVGRGVIAVSQDAIRWQRVDLPPSKLLCGRIQDGRLFRPDPVNYFGWTAGPGMFPWLRPISSDGQTWRTINHRPIFGNVVDGETRLLTPERNAEYAVLYSEDGVTWTRLRPKPAATVTMDSASNAPTITQVSGVRISFELNGQLYHLPELPGAVGKVYELETSIDLEHWQTLTTLTNSADGFHFIDPEATRYPQRFYRLKPKPEL
jgi:hypothetical protein